jgi:CBS domain-containing protein
MNKASLLGHRPPENPVCLDSSLTVSEGCAALSMHKISSAPVYDMNEGGFIGMLDFRDLITYVLEIFHKIPRPQQSFDAEMVLLLYIYNTITIKGNY